MQQAPASIKYAIIGNGRLASHLCEYFTLMGINFMQWYRSGDSPFALDDDVTYVLMAIKDSAISTFAEQNQAILANRVLIHFSGCNSFDGINGVHPLCNFPNFLYDLKTYQRIPFFVESESLSFADLFPQLENKNFVIPKAQKSYYHALCVIGNNLSTMMWQKFLTDMEEKFKVDPQYLMVYVEQTLKSIATDYKNALTGPFSRGDSQTLAKNLASLEGDPYYEIFKSFINNYEAGR